ncbi:MAG: hypothetical protein MOGMAGMI_01572 [Candidatus Omnitrophica bacterium]|nr:hypothetical protein [Candidatus Omnitrophota bacterium]
MMVFLSAVSACAEEAGTSDPAAEYFFYRCTACHSVGEGARTGPDLVASTAWSRPDLTAAVKAMEKRVGPIPQDQLDRVVDFLKDPDVQRRIAGQKAKIEAKMKKELPQASREIGNDLFMGTKMLSGGGPACASCHAFRGGAATLGPDLTDIHTKASPTLLQAAIQGANYRLMKPIYDTRRITAEEALHLAEYLSFPERVPVRTLPDLRVIVTAASVGAVGCLAGLWMIGRRRKRRAADLLARSGRRKG